MTHVFIVNEITFKYHLEYMFAGTGAKDKQTIFLTKSHNKHIQPVTERNLVAMIADISRVKVGDKIIFYLQATSYMPGMFFGVFQAVSNPFFDENDENNYLRDCLGKGLSYRVLLAPLQVFPFGITERELLDNIADKEHPYQLCWSLIYRKLKGNRGCTMITDYEYEDLYNKLVVRNSCRFLPLCNFTFDVKHNAIVGANSTKRYLGRQNSIDIEPRMKYKVQSGNAFETHLQAFVVQQIAARNAGFLNLLGVNPTLDFWIGNEVSCGVGMQRIDVMIIQEVGNNVVNIIPIELKDEEPTEMIISQLYQYVEWIRQYVSPNYRDRLKKVQIFPRIIAPKTTNVMLRNRLIQQGVGYISIALTNNEFIFNRLN